MVAGPVLHSSAASTANKIKYIRSLSKHEKPHIFPHSGVAISYSCDLSTNQNFSYDRHMKMLCRCSVNLQILLQGYLKTISELIWTAGHQWCYVWLWSCTANLSLALFFGRQFCSNQKTCSEFSQSNACFEAGKKSPEALPVGAKVAAQQDMRLKFVDIRAASYKNFGSRANDRNSEVQRPYENFRVFYGLRIFFYWRCQPRLGYTIGPATF